MKQHPLALSPFSNDPYAGDMEIPKACRSLPNCVFKLPTTLAPKDDSTPEMAKPSSIRQIKKPKAKSSQVVDQRSLNGEMR